MNNHISLIYAVSGIGALFDSDLDYIRVAVWSLILGIAIGVAATRGKVLAAIRAVRNDREVETEELRAALGGLVDRLDTIVNAPAYMAVWESYAVHGQAYSGPTWVDALERARSALGEYSDADRREARQILGIEG